jgi:hypothetical protein
MAKASQEVTPMPATGTTARPRETALLLAAGTGLLYYCSEPLPAAYFDYTLRVAEAFTHGSLGLTSPPPSWLNEFVPSGHLFYSVFPLGSVLTMVPVALLKRLGFFAASPSAFLSAFIAASCAYLLYMLAGKNDDAPARRLVLSLWALFGTWMWCNLVYAGAWQLALGFAVLGEIGALYFTLVRPRPLVAGCFFALAFGNRTEVIVTAPLFIYFLVRGVPQMRGTTDTDTRPNFFRQLLSRRRAVLLFSAVPLVLLCLTGVYNYVRFGSPLDFGYSSIPAIQNEGWFQHGLFSVRAIPANAYAMLFEPWRLRQQFPYLIPSGFGGSILISSPFLLLLLRRGARDRGALVAAWLAVAALTLVLWLHANPGGWQFSYRYAMVLIPWFFLILLENGRARSLRAEVPLAALSIAINLFATYLFSWTDYVRP